MTGTCAMKAIHVSKTAVERHPAVVLRILGKSCSAAKKSAAKKRCIGFRGAATTRGEACTYRVQCIKGNESYG